MSQSIQAWLNRPDIADLKRQNDEGELQKLFSKDFFRDPLRNIYHDRNVFYSHADGVVLYTHEKLDPIKDLLEIKGKHFNLQDLLEDKTYDSPSLVIGIFMTYLDVHINRVPIDSYFSDERATPFLYTHNISMVFLENELLKELHYSPERMKYLFHNERKICTFYSAVIHGRYYLTQIGDKEVEVISNWDQGNYLKQGQRFGMIRWGSQVDLIIPLNPLELVKYEILVKPLDHVEAGLDPIIRISTGEKNGLSI